MVVHDGARGSARGFIELEKLKRQKWILIKLEHMEMVFYWVLLGRESKRRWWEGPWLIWGGPNLSQAKSKSKSNERFEAQGGLGPKLELESRALK